MITIISSESDIHAREVIDRLNHKGAKVTLLDMSEFPQEQQLSIEYNGNRPKHRILLKGADLDLNFMDCGVIWWRRPQPFTLHPEVRDADDKSFAYTECHSAFSGLWLTLDAFWINHPTRDEEASRKVYQLKVAQELGFRVPATCITNSPERAQQFVDEYGLESTIYKAFSGTERAWRETRKLQPNELDLIDSVNFAPVIFQEYIEAEADLRITVLGDNIFPAAIYSQETSYAVDFRMAMNEARIESVDLPEHVSGLLHSYMKRLGLVYGAIDMRITPDGEYVFLEINPSGQWLFVEQRTSQPITDSMVNLMLYHDQR